MKMTIGKKLGLGFGIVLLIFVISGIVTISQLRGIKENLHKIVNVETPTSDAAREMEIGLVGIGFGVLGYLNDHDPVHLQRIQKGVADYEQFKERYLELAYADERILGLALNERYDNYIKLANKIIALEDEQDKKLVTLFKNHDDMDTLLDEKIQVSIDPNEPQAYDKMQAAMELEINVNGIAKGLGEFLRAREAKYEQRVLKDETDFRRFLKVYEGLSLTSEEKQWASEISRLFEDSAKLSEEIIGLDKEIYGGAKEFVRLRREMDAMLDDEILPLSDKYLLSADEKAGKSIDVANYVSLTLLILGIVIGGCAAVFITRGVTNPVRKLVEVSAIVAKGDLTPEMEVKTNHP